MRVAARLAGYALMLAAVAAAGWVGGRTLGPVDANSPSHEPGRRESSEHTTAIGPAPATDDAPTWTAPAPATGGQTVTALIEAASGPVSGVPVMAAAPGPVPFESVLADPTRDTRSADPRRLADTGLPMPAQAVTVATMPSGGAMGSPTTPGAVTTGTGGNDAGAAHPVGGTVPAERPDAHDDRPGPGGPGKPGGSAGQAGLPTGGGDTGSKAPGGPPAAAGEHGADTHGDKHGGKVGR